MTVVEPVGTPLRAGRPALRVAVRGGTLAVTGAAVLLPGLGVRAPGDEPGAPFEFDPREFLGRKGVRYKDRATLLGASAAALALADAGVVTDEPSPATGVVVASCYGNVETVCRVAAEIDAAGVPSTSPMDLPNASSNVVAATVAIRHRLTGVCLSVCNGHDSGWASLLWAWRLIAARRAQRVLVVGVETPSDPERVLRGPGAAPLLDGAAAVVVEAADDELAPPLEDAGATVAALAGHETAGVGGVLHAAVASRRDVLLDAGGRP